MDNQQLEPIYNGSNEFVMYSTEDGKTEIHLRVVDGTVWMTQAEMSELFAVSRSSISEHIKAIINSGELQRKEVVRKFRKVQGQGVQGRSLDHYNLDAVMAVGYRVRGPRGIQFRAWATLVLKEYLVKGFALNDEKLKDPRGKDYFSELLERIRDIRSSEARLYLELRNIIALADDYDKKDPRNVRIFANIQDRLLAAVTGLTAAEIISTRSDPQADNMGLTTWRGKKVGKSDVRTAKNYLHDNEIRELNLLVSSYLEYAQLQAERRRVIHVQDWVDRTAGFISFNGYDDLLDHGRITRKRANELADKRYELFNAGRKAKELDELETQYFDELTKTQQVLEADRDRLTPRK
ncbi:hydroxyacid dehydrogenase [Corynebacterium sp. HMSC072D12]|uniref:RhuM family protein n=1 Tax=Corynebacterium sp. HMSC072D12 TaxID=1739447 RepID=UPI0008A1FCB7|nr:RhuM family protein [Corynebacterium sp. HMSC072D12]OFQ33983.1 hydroxyacid dehydrogenase [Corynebacterium sp. HMSC072D12]